jgi:hypothetical protein
VGPGLKNAVGEYNCFLNVIIQVLDRLGSKLASFMFSIVFWIKQNIGYFLGDKLVQGICINHLYALLSFCQSLWHIKRFREEFLATCSLHSHISHPCVVCALYEIFVALNKASGGEDDAVEPSTLRLALSNLYPDSNFFQEVISE